MRYSLFIASFLFAGALFLLTSCDIEHHSQNISAQASADLAKTREKGVSEINYDPSTGMNVCVWTEIIILESFSINAAPGALSVDDEYQTNKKNKDFLSLKTGLGYVMKGQKFKQSDTKFTFHYLELPVYALYHHSLGETGGLYAGLGPYFAYGIGGKEKSPDFSQSVFGKDNGGYKRFDAGLGFKAGYEFKSGLYADITYEMGLVNLLYADVKSHMRCTSLNIGYNLANFTHKEKKK